MPLRNLAVFNTYRRRFGPAQHELLRLQKHIKTSIFTHTETLTRFDADVLDVVAKHSECALHGDELIWFSETHEYPTPIETWNKDNICKYYLHICALHHSALRRNICIYYIHELTTK